jgi:hypothetical protein
MEVTELQSSAYCLSGNLVPAVELKLLGDVRKDIPVQDVFKIVKTVGH